MLTPVTILNSGRSPAAVQPFRRPAAKAPLSPPPEMARKATGGSGPAMAGLGEVGAFPAGAPRVPSRAEWLGVLIDPESDVGRSGDVSFGSSWPGWSGPWAPPTAVPAGRRPTATNDNARQIMLCIKEPDCRHCCPVKRVNFRDVPCKARFHDNHLQLALSITFADFDHRL